MKNFEIQHKLGSGSYGVIYKALNKSSRSICVLKQINLTRLNEKAKKNAVNQATIMGKLNHPFIVRYQDSFIQDRTLNIVMEYCDGGDLAYYLKQQNKKYIKEQKIWKFFLQICLGLEHIHKNKILHRDIKTLNIFLNKNEQVKIGDLGVAKILSNNDFAQTMVGTPFYLSPQLCQEKPYNQKSDIWALGCLLYELCTFRHPFQAANQASLILKIIRGKYLPIPEFYSKDLKDMIDCCLERDYKRRPTANMILNKPRIKDLIEEFKFKQIIDSQNKKNLINIPVEAPKKTEIKSVEKKAQPKVQKIKQEVRPKLIQKPEIQKNYKVQKIELPKNKVVEKPRQEKKIYKAFEDYAPEQKKVKQIQVKQHRPLEEKKVLFGDKMQNKADFISRLEQKVEDDPPKTEKKKVEKKLPPPPTYFQIPWKEKDKNIGFGKKPENFYQKQQRSKKKSIDSPPMEDKIVVHSQRLALITETPQVKKPEVIHKVKVQKEVVSRVYQSQKNMRPKGIIKSGGFSQQAEMKNPLQERKKSQIISKIEDKKVQVSKHQSKHVEKSQMDKQSEKYMPKSEKNIKSEFAEKPSAIVKKKESNAGVPHYPPRVRRNPKQDMEKVQYKKVPNKTKTSHSRYSQISKQEQDLVANLPDIVKKGDRQSDSDDEQNVDMNKKFKLNQINDEIVLKKYEQIVDKTETDDPSYEECYEESYDKKQLFGEEEIVQQQIQIQNESVKVQIQEEELPNEHQEEQNNSMEESGNEETKINYEDEEVYEINNFDMEGDYEQRPISQSNHEWEYDEEPELPLLQQTEAPFFEEANPYLVDQKVEEENTEDKKQYLQIKLKQNMKREDQINRLMQIKIQQCRSMVPKGFQDILAFFRTKINMKQEYTDQDEREVEEFLRKRNLTDHRKFQNIYKIMHFEMELENTRKIIQTICKKLSDLEN